MLIPVTSPQEMGVWDAQAKALGIPEAVLMENAALAVFRELEFLDLRGKNIWIFAGGGNNGGDGVCLARHVADAGAFPVIFHTKKLGRKGATLNENSEKSSESSENAAILNAELARKCGVPFVCLEKEFQKSPEDFSLPAAFSEVMAKAETLPDIIVDSLLGTGFHGDLRPTEANIICFINKFKGHAFICSVDIPSGLSASCAVRADLTIALEAPKPLLLLPQSAPYVGRLVVRTIGIPQTIRCHFPASWAIWADTQNFTLSDGLVSRKKAVTQQIAGKYAQANALQASTEQANTIRASELPANTAANKGTLLTCGMPAVGGADGMDCPPNPAHKGDAGTVLIWTSCPQYAGACRLSAYGALRGGAGLVAMAGSAETLSGVRADLPEVICLDFSDERDDKAVFSTKTPENLAADSCISSVSASHIRKNKPLLQKIPPRCHVLVLGPGLGLESGENCGIVRRFLTERQSALADFTANSSLAGFSSDVISTTSASLKKTARPPLSFILDADALNVLAHERDLLSLLTAGDILTPHPAEAARLLQISTEEVQSDRPAALRALLRLAPCTWILKGAGTLCAAPQTPVFICPINAPLLSVGGSGDVLAGLTAALLAQHVSLSLTSFGHAEKNLPYSAVCAAVQIHALAGRLLEKRFPAKRGAFARDIAHALPEAAALFWGGDFI